MKRVTAYNFSNNQMPKFVFLRTSVLCLLNCSLHMPSASMTKGTVAPTKFWTEIIEPLSKNFHECVKPIFIQVDNSRPSQLFLATRLCVFAFICIRLWLHVFHLSVWSNHSLSRLLVLTDWHLSLESVPVQLRHIYLSNIAHSRLRTVTVISKTSANDVTSASHATPHTMKIARRRDITLARIIACSDYWKLLSAIVNTL